MKTKVKEPKTLLFDIETKPVKVWVWRTGQQYVRHPMIVANEKFDIICICYKWAGEKTVHALDWGLKKQDSSSMINKFSKVIEQADLVIGHNSNSFDIKQVNTQRLLHRQAPISWPTPDDTLKQLRKKFYLTSFSLEYVANILTGTGKDKMTFQDWPDIVDKKCPKALRKMVKYCKNDVNKLEEVWEIIRPYVDSGVHRGLINGAGAEACPSCGKNHVIKYGIRTLRAGRYQKYQCYSCGYVWKSSKKLKVE